MPLRSIVSRPGVESIVRCPRRIVRLLIQGLDVNSQLETDIAIDKLSSTAILRCLITISYLCGDIYRDCAV